MFLVSGGQILQSVRHLIHHISEMVQVKR